MRIYDKEKIPENFVLACSYTAAEFIDEEVYHWRSLVEIKDTDILYFHNKDGKYQHEIWMPKTLVEELNSAFKKNSIAEKNIVTVITETDEEYGYNIFVAVASSPEKALEVCTQLQIKELGQTVPLMLNADKTQVGESRNGEFWSTVYFLEEVEVQ